MSVHDESNNDEKPLDIAPGVDWNDCTVEQRINRLVIALYNTGQQLEFLQETLLTHEHVQAKEEKKE